jgi:hypothetical protein
MKHSIVLLAIILVSGFTTYGQTKNTNAGNMENGEFEVVPSQICRTELTLSSSNSDVTTALRIKNNTSGNLTSYWINYSGERDTSAGQIRPIAAGKFIDIQTYVTHPFIIIDTNGKCRGIYQATAKPSIAIIKD